MMSILKLLSGKKESQSTGTSADEESVDGMKAGAIKAGNSSRQSGELATLSENAELCDDLSNLDYKRAHREPGAKVGTFESLAPSEKLYLGVLIVGQVKLSSSDCAKGP